MQLVRLALSISEAAEAAGVSRSFLYRAIQRGNGPATIKMGADLRILVSDLEAWLRTLRHAA